MLYFRVLVHFHFAAANILPAITRRGLIRKSAEGIRVSTAKFIVNEWSKFHTLHYSVLDKFKKRRLSELTVVDLFF